MRKLIIVIRYVISNVSFRGLVLVDLFSTMTDIKCSFLQLLIVFFVFTQHSGSVPPLIFLYRSFKFLNSIHHWLISILTSATRDPGKGKAYFSSLPRGNVYLQRLKSFY